MAWTRAPRARVTHSLTCARVFRRYDQSCPRCQELAGGAAPREGWGDRKRRDDLRHAEECRAHFTSYEHRSGGCGPVCTFGQW